MVSNFPFCLFCKISLPIIQQPCLSLFLQDPTKTHTRNFCDVFLKKKKKNYVDTSLLKPPALLWARKSETPTVGFKSHITFHRMDVILCTLDGQLNFLLLFAPTENNACTNILVYPASSTGVLFIYVFLRTAF